MIASSAIRRSHAKVAKLQKRKVLVDIWPERIFHKRRRCGMAMHKVTIRTRRYCWGPIFDRSDDDPVLDCDSRKVID